MNTFLMIMTLLPESMLAVQTLYGDSLAGADKKKILTDGIAIALQGATDVTGTGTEDSALADVSAKVATNLVDVLYKIHSTTKAWKDATATGNKLAAAKTPVTPVPAGIDPTSFPPVEPVVTVDTKSA